MTPTKWQKRVDAGDWEAITAEANDFGGALLPRLLTPAETSKIRQLYPDDHLFRATIDMRRYRFGEGEYRYFERPYPEPIEQLKQALYPRLLPIARDWWTKLGRTSAVAGHPRRVAPHVPRGGPDEVDGHPTQVRRGRLERATPRPLRRLGVSTAGGDQPERTGGGPHRRRVPARRAASARPVRGTATLLPHGHGFLFATRERPVRSARGWSPAPVRHGVSALRSGERFTLGLVFHDAA